VDGRGLVGGIVVQDQVQVQVKVKVLRHGSVDELEEPEKLLVAVPPVVLAITRPPDDVGAASGPLLETARNNARGTVVTGIAGLLATGALVFTARNFVVSQRTLALTEQGQVTDRYTKAIEQLGSDKLDVPIGGIYALERIARDSARDHSTVMEVLSTFVREHSAEKSPGPLSGIPKVLLVSGWQPGAGPRRGGGQQLGG
jgi:hypothetical protein